MVFLVRSNAVNGSQHDLHALGEWAVDLRAHLPRLPASPDPHYGLLGSFRSSKGSESFSRFVIALLFLHSKQNKPELKDRRDIDYKESS